MDKLIITAAVTGSLVTPEQNPDLPVTPIQIAEAAIEAGRAGAAVAHLHVRDPETGAPVQEAALFAEVIRRIRTESDIIINVSTGGGPGMTPDQRIGIIPELCADQATAPEMASLNAGSVNFGILSNRTKDFVLSAVQVNPWEELKRFAETMRVNRVKPEVEAYEAGMINNARVLASLEALAEPIHFQFVLGILGAMAATPENVVFLKTGLPAGATWSVCAPGLDVFRIGPVAMASGGHVRVGLEDSVWLARGVRAESNAQLVQKTVKLAQLMDREVATPAQARGMLGLEPGKA